MTTSQVAATLRGFAKHIGISRPQATPHVSKVVMSSSADKKDVVSKGDLVRAIAEEHDLSAAKSERILSTVFDTIAESVAQKKTVRISNFGTFDSLETKARTGRNPSNGEPIHIPAKERPRFKAYSAFKDAVNK